MGLMNTTGTRKRIDTCFTTSLATKNCLPQKELTKNALRERLGLERNDFPLISCVARLVPQKGLDLIRHCLLSSQVWGKLVRAARNLPRPPNSSGVCRLGKSVSRPPKYPPYLALNQGGLTHQIFAGSDMFIVPSLFEPCGLTQLIALKYGTVPIVHKIGGLADTIFDVDTSEKPIHEKWVRFRSTELASFEKAVKRAIKCRSEAPEKWKNLVSNGVRQASSWRKPAQLYLDLYHLLNLF